MNVYLRLYCRPGQQALAATLQWSVSQKPRVVNNANILMGVVGVVDRLRVMVVVGMAVARKGFWSERERRERG